MTPPPSIPHHPPPPGMKIRADYVPKVRRKNQNGEANNNNNNSSSISSGSSQKPKKSNKDSKNLTQICPVCSQPIPINEISQHVRIELLDPKWREQKAKILERNKDSNLADSGAAITANLKKLAVYRTDIFGGDDLSVKKILEEDKEKIAKKAATVWDGHTASASAISKQNAIDIDEQIATIHRNKGLTVSSNIGPQILPPSNAAPSIDLQPAAPSVSIQESSSTIVSSNFIDHQFSKKRPLETDDSNNGTANDTEQNAKRQKQSAPTPTDTYTYITITLRKSKTPLPPSSKSKFPLPLPPLRIATSSISDLKTHVSKELNISNLQAIKLYKQEFVYGDHGESREVLKLLEDGRPLRLYGFDSVEEVLLEIL